MRNLRFSALLASGLSLTWLGVGGAFAAPPTPSPDPTPSASSSPIAVQSVSPLNPKQLRVAFVQALESEAQALRQRHRAETADLKASQKARRKDFESRERDQRRDFFKANSQPAKRRDYIKDFISRRKALNQMMVDEAKTRKSEQSSAEDSLRSDQKRRLAEFDAAIAVGQRPSDLLWPQPGR